MKHFSQQETLELSETADAATTTTAAVRQSEVHATIVVYKVLPYAILALLPLCHEVGRENRPASTRHNRRLSRIKILTLPSQYNNTIILDTGAYDDRSSRMPHLYSPCTWHQILLRTAASYPVVYQVPRTTIAYYTRHSNIRHTLKSTRRVQGHRTAGDMVYGRKLQIVDRVRPT